jgi:predicted nuclease of predicted toxin-antitoxin system
LTGGAPEGEADDMDHADLLARITQLPRRSSHVLRSAGHDSIHTLDLPQGNATADGEVARRSGAESRVVVSHLLSGEPARLLVVATANITNAALLTLFTERLDDIVAAVGTRERAFVELHRDQLVIHGAGQ